MRNLVRLCCALAVASLMAAATSPTAVRSSARASSVSNALVAPGALSFSAASYNANESDGNVTFTLTRTGGADNRVSAKVTLSDVTTSPDDYVFVPGRLDLTFNPASGAQALALQPDGKIIAGSTRLNSDGSLDNTFNVTAGVNGLVRAVTLQPDGRVILGGNFTIARFNSNGSLDNTFNAGVNVANTGPDYRVRATALQPDGKVFVGGFFDSPVGNYLARLNADGSLDNSFDASAAVGFVVYAIAVQPDGKVIAGGEIGLGRFNSDGTVDATFNPGAGLNGVVRVVLLQPDGKIIVGGDFTSVGGATRNGIARLNANGSIDNTFNPGSGATGSIFGGVQAAALQPDGKLVVGGDFTAFGGTPRGYVARLNSDGTLDTAFVPADGGANNPVRAAVIQTDGKIIVAGTFDTFGVRPRNGIARLYGDLFATWEAGDTSDKTVSFPLVDDTTAESSETLTLTLTPLGGATAGANTSATLTITDNDSALSSVSGSGGYRGTATLTATLTLSGSPLSGKSVAFTLNGESVGSATTNASGVATLTNVALSGLFNAGTHPNAVGASFAGESGISGSSSTGALTVAKASQTITFGGLASKTFGDADFGLSANVTSNLPIVFSASGQCSVTGSTVHLTGAGSCTITASQPGDSNYNAAPDVARSFDIAKGISSTAVTSSANPSALGQSVTFTATVTAAPGVPTGTVQFEIDGANVGGPAALSGGVATFTTSSLSVGSHAVKAKYGGDSNFEASSGTLAAGQNVGSFIEFSQSSHTVAEGASLTVTVRRTGDTTQAASIDYATDDGSTPSVVVPCSSVTGLALDRCDYTKALGTLHFAAGETEKTLQILVGDDSYVEGPESAHVRLSNPSANSTLGANSSAAFTITDDSPESAGNTIDDTNDFVRQHYLDFLNREPDAPGFQFWRNNIESCGTNAQCREAKRVHTSAAFFLSIEFQETGYLVYRAYKAAYGDATSPGVSGTVPVIRLDEFLPDTQRIGLGVVVGQGAWQVQLEANKVAYFQEFVTRARFANAAPASMTPAQFVDALFTNAGVTPTAAQRQAAIDEFAGASNTADTAARARALRLVAENPALHQKEFNRAFVLMEYFGYLRRNPDDAPEPTLNYAGWRFWLTKLEQFNGDFVRAEMVKAFLSSDEYRHRFGQ